jgi:hypothetical protein
MYWAWGGVDLVVNLMEGINTNRNERIRKDIQEYGILLAYERKEFTSSNISFILFLIKET